MEPMQVVVAVVLLGVTGVGLAMHLVAGAALLRTLRAALGRALTGGA